MYSVLIIGSGRRIQTNFLPALTCLKEHFKIVGIYSRTEANRNAVAQKWGLPSVADLNQVDFSKINLVVMSITLDSNKQILRQLNPYSSNLILVIDTPVLPLKDLAAIRLLNRFKKVVVTEDFMNFPQFNFMREFLKENYLGKLQKIQLNQSGYRYHGLALIRSFLNFESIFYSRKKNISSQDVNIDYRFKNGVNGCITEPYKRLAGTITLVGSRGILTTEDIKIGSTLHNLSVYKLKEVWEKGNFQGFIIEGQDLSLSSQIPLYDILRNIPNPDDSHFNVLKTCGLIQVFKSLLETNIHSQYTMYDGLYDQVLSSLARRFNLFFDFLGLGVKGFISYKLIKTRIN